jgi:solute:Na+ symporter, SSS family
MLAVATLRLDSYGIAVFPLYLLVTMVIGWVSRRHLTGANDFLNASRSLPLWIVVAAFLAANCGALEIVGLSAMAAQYGVQAFHIYWIGAIPGMVFLGWFMIPVYMRSGVRSLPEYLERRFDSNVRLINSWLILVTGTALSGIALYAMAQVLHVVFGWSFSVGAFLVAGIVMLYVILGGLRATIYNEVFQLLIIVLGLLPLLLHRTGRIFAFVSHLPGSQGHLWLGLPSFSQSSSLDRFGVIAGLGFVLSFSYWCTDFVQIQRALTARTVAAGRFVPLLAGFGKLGFSLMVVVPSLGAAAFLGHRMPAPFDQTMPALMTLFYGPALLGVGMTALLASLMSSLAANVSAFSAVWTEEIYRRSIRAGAAEQHYIRIGRASTVVAVMLSIASSYLAFSFHDLMEYVQLIFSLFAAPFFAIFLMGIFTRRTTARGAVAGLCSGVFLALVHHGLVATGYLVYGSLMSANFYVAVYAFLTALGIGLLFSRRAERKDDTQLKGLVYERGQSSTSAPVSITWWILACLLLAACAALNYLWR